MIKYNLHKNGWTILIDDLDLNIASQDELHFLAKLCAYYTCVKIKNQNLTVDRQVEIVKSYKDPHILYNKGHKFYDHYSLDKEGYICRVTGKKDQHGEEGIAGHTAEMLWHNEQPQIRGSSSIAYLYAVEGVQGSSTVWNNTIPAFSDLDSEYKEKIKNLKCIYFGNVTHSSERSRENFDNRKIHENIKVPLVFTNRSGQIGINLSLHQFERFDGMTREQSLEIAEPLFEFITKEKYCYIHDWEDGDVSYSDQWLGVHRRLYFGNMKNRMVHRATFDYPDINYTL
jgi:alpha-ketoglutarate-dependent 2,4-dichlorophenoxyacetate dioxygenase